MLSDPILSEVEKVFEKSYYRRRYSSEDAKRLANLLRRNAIIVVPNAGIANIAAHAQDDLVIATAVAG